MGLWTTTRPFFLALLWRPGPWSDTLSPGAPVSSPQQPAQRAALRQLVRATTAAIVRVCGAHRLAGWSCPSIALLPRAGARLLHTRRGGEAAAATATWRRDEVCCFGRGGGDYVWLAAGRATRQSRHVQAPRLRSKKQVFAKTQIHTAVLHQKCMRGVALAGEYTTRGGCNACQHDGEERCATQSACIRCTRTSRGHVV